MRTSGLDVCLILEGTYPFSMGGVSTWVDALMRGLPEVNFGLVHLRTGTAPASRFKPPANLREMMVVNVDGFDRSEIVPAEWVNTATLPGASVYHALSTGYAGLLAVQIKEATGAPFILTEHGIYWHEMASGAMELECGFKVIPDNGALAVAALREHWTATFKDLARQAYAVADDIVTVCGANQRLQLAAGAPPERCRIISNGVDWCRADHYAQTRYDRRGGQAPRIGFVGRIVPIKDCETFVHACALVARALPDAQYVVAGSEDQDPDYALKSRALVRKLEADVPGFHLHFAGEVNAWELYPTLDIVVLTSLSEALPFTALEAMSVGVPVVATDVGGCGELLNGDDDLGPAGLLTPVRDPQATAGAIVTVLQDHALRAHMSRAGRERIRRRYTLDHCISAYAETYAHYRSRASDPAPRRV
jgi:glycosyltransferase involved in cell wall biosynthesis